MRQRIQYGRILLCVAAMAGTAALDGCRRDMQDQPRYQPLQGSRFFSDGRASRPIPAGTISQDDVLQQADPLHSGANAAGDFLQEIPIPVTGPVLARGRERFDIYCSPCHSRIGDGNGMIARRGVKYPANLHADRVRQAPPGYLFQVISNGYGAMPEYSDRISAEDRWAIIAYVRALELSHNATLDDVPAAKRVQLEGRK